MYPFSRYVARVFRKNCRTVLPCFLLAACWTTTPPPPITATATPAPTAQVHLPEVAAAEFGIWDRDSVFQLSYDVPLRAGTTFGWRLYLPCKDGFVQVREEFHLPAPGDWGSDPDMWISPDQKSVEVRASAECVLGWIEKRWSVSPQDPPGTWTIRVTAAGYAPKSFHASFAPDPAP